MFAIALFTWCIIVHELLHVLIAKTTRAYIGFRVTWVGPFVLANANKMSRKNARSFFVLPFLIPAFFLTLFIVILGIAGFEREMKIVVVVFYAFLASCAFDLWQAFKLAFKLDFVRKQ